MKFTKQTLAFALLSGTSFAISAATVELYGKANLTFQSSDEGEGSFTELKSNFSRIGLKGDYKLDDGLRLVYKAEFQVDMDGDSDNITDRNQYLGLRGAFGEVLLGNNDTVLKQSQGKIDLFSDLNGDIKSLWKGENRVGDSVTYKSPKYSGLQFGLTYIAEESADAQDGVSVSLIYGDAKLKASNLYASIAVDSEVAGYDVVRASVQGKVAGVTLGAIAQTQENVESGKETDGFMVSAKYGLSSKVDLKAQVQFAEEDGGDSKSGITLGADYKLGKNTKLFGFYTAFDMDTSRDEDYLAIGLEYNF